MQTGEGTSWDSGVGATSLLTVALLASAVGAGDVAAASLLVAPAATGRSRAMPGLLGSIAIGALVLGALGWAGTALLDVQVSTGVAAGLGVAVGGGIGAMVWFLAVGESGDQEGMETVAVEMEDEAAAEPAPEPADLFAANPDPIVYFAGEEPVVRTVNPAFEETFGVHAGSLADADLSEAVMADGDVDDLLAAIGDGEDYDDVHDCETVQGARRMRLRLAVTGSDVRTDGYLIYTPLPGDVA